mmetsp:Transcript_10540/g.20923  ORF Transcript_10540/g.20923 Transcript_10540/m.20923 type:complete len:95 (+) Transcript_10540:35-319(+)
MGRIRKGARALRINKEYVTEMLKMAGGRDSGPEGVCAREMHTLLECMGKNDGNAATCVKEKITLARCARTAAQETNLRMSVRKNLIYQIMKMRF